VLLSGVNDSNEDARLTGALLRRAQRAIEARTAAPAGAASAAASSSKGAAQGASKCRGGRARELVKLNVIPYNPTYGVGGALMFDAPSNERVFAFARIVRVEFGIRCTARVEMGQDIDGACGQLAIATKPRAAAVREGVAAPPTVADVEDLYARGRGRGGARSAAGSSGSGSKRRAPRAAATAATAAAATAAASRTRAAIVLIALACLVLAAHFALGGGGGEL